MKLNIDLSKKIGPIKPMNAVNNAPAWKKYSDQDISNMAAYKAAEIPYARTHDASIEYSYGREHCVDINGIFPDFDADVDDPKSYDFHLTDEYIHRLDLAGTKCFYRLGCCIEHWTKKYGTLPPKDFLKWAKICDHIISHYNNGWNDGFEKNIEYWEIWNEPDGSDDDAPAERKLTWGGTRQQFFEFYETVAEYLKARHPECKIGGPALCAPNHWWTEPFLAYLTRDGKRVPLDFFSWHGYCSDPRQEIAPAKKAREMLDKYGYTKTESVFNEWNYIRSFEGSQFVKDLEVERSLKGAAFIGHMMNLMQDCPVDLLMYYDARTNSIMNGMFNIYDMSCLKGYYPIKEWSGLTRLGDEYESVSDDDMFSAVTAYDGKRCLTLIAYYTDLEDQPEKDVEIEIKGAPSQVFCRSTLDDSHDFDDPLNCRIKDGRLKFRMKPNTMLKLWSK